MLDRRNLLKAWSGACDPGRLPAPRAARAADPVFQPAPGDWRGYEVRTIIEVASSEPVQIWAPAAAFDDPGWSRPLGTNGPATPTRSSSSAIRFIAPQWFISSGGAGRRSGAQRSSVGLRPATGRSRSPRAAARPASLAADERALFLKPTAFIPTDGIVKETSDRIVAGAATDRDKARAIYDWLVANTERVAATPGCGSGDVTRDAVERTPRRQMRRHQRAFCRARPRRWPSRPRPLRHPRRPVALRL